MTDYALLVFDWDGTLVDSIARIVDSMKAAARETALPERDDTGSRASSASACPRRLLRSTRRLATLLWSSVSGVPTVSITWRRRRSRRGCSRRGRSHGAFSRGRVPPGGRHRQSRRGLDRVLAGHGWSDFFDITRCADETASKPDPLMLHEILAHCRVEPGRALMIGDSPFDLEMARRAGMDSVAVAYGAQSLEQLRPYAPRLEVEHFTELRAWLGGARREAVSGVVEHV